MNLNKPLNYIPTQIMNASDYESLASNFIDPKNLAYIDGGSQNNKTLVENRNAFFKYNIIPKVFSDIKNASTKIDLFNQTLEHPFLLAPLAYQKLAHSEGELATAMASEATNTIMISSTLSSYSMEDISKRAGLNKWFQLYIQDDFNDTLDLIKRAYNSGYQAIVITIDAAVQLPSKTAINAGFSMPKDIKAINLNKYKQNNKNNQNDIFKTYSQNSVSIQIIEKIMKYTNLPIVVKGVLSKYDAISLKKLGVNAIIVSNHGGRTIDGVPSSLSMIKDIRKALGDDYPILFDSGIRSGQDAYKAIALGANAILIGRLQVYSLGVAGALGVAHMLKLLRQELELTMAVCGNKTIKEINEKSLIKGN